MALSEVERIAIEEDLQALTARVRQLRAKMERGEELSDQERIELSACSDRIQALLARLERG